VIRILLQFLLQAIGVIVLRVRKPEMPRPFRMWLYPIPALIAFAGWCFLFLTTDRPTLLYSLVALASGVFLFAAWRVWVAKSPVPRKDPGPAEGI